MLNVLTLLLIVIHQNNSWLSLKSELKLFKFWTHQSHAYAYRVELPDENYELVPEADEDLANAGVNAVEVQQGRDESSKDFTTDCASEDKHWSIFPLSYATICMDVCAFTFRSWIETLVAWS
jgi:hypothetical protein